MDEMRLRVVIAPDEFGGTLSARAAAAAIADGWRCARPADLLDLLPQSDGGPGFIDVLASSGIGAPIEVSVAGPLGDAVLAQVLIDGTTAYIESAQACGLHLVTGGPSPETAWRASTAGVGDLILAALRAGAVRIVVGLGGSGTTDGGRGAADRLGGVPRARALLRDVDLVAATDVGNPLLGPTGAAAVFGPQKGADPATIGRLEARLAEWADELENAETGAGRVIRDVPGAGAAGGLGAFLVAVGGRRETGADVVAAATGRPARIAAADLVVTGEGRVDTQTAFGKVVAALGAEARRAGVPAVVLAGQVDEADLTGIVAAYSMVESAGSVTRSITEPVEVLTALAADVAKDVRRLLG
ncbi:glycerate kinase [Gordonia neofelifaecis]|uniref:Glycerate kinase n=1 Tax=Gordonia neofelifaecis NRRL B-59395 TaxID=644548 RepID=F1YHH1_9ACTN|nr:glycerate kinase [Gordonia neofelifaecis]EGD55809.1 glycerate kinase [Gordonia neofelifaecis NRRL B-59395]